MLSERQSSRLHDYVEESHTRLRLQSHRATISRTSGPTWIRLQRFQSGPDVLRQRWRNLSFPKWRKWRRKLQRTAGLRQPRYKHRFPFRDGVLLAASNGSQRVAWRIAGQRYASSVRHWRAAMADSQWRRWRI